MENADLYPRCNIDTLQVDFFEVISLEYQKSLETASASFQKLTCTPHCQRERAREFAAIFS